MGLFDFFKKKKDGEELFEIYSPLNGTIMFTFNIKPDYYIKFALKISC